MYGMYTDMSGGTKAAEKRLRALLEPLQVRHPASRLAEDLPLQRLAAAAHLCHRPTALVSPSEDGTPPPPNCRRRWTLSRAALRPCPGRSTRP